MRRTGRGAAILSPVGTLGKTIPVHLGQQRDRLVRRRLRWRKSA
ncbi:hypothetical protein [Ralstonia sp. 24A2]